MKPDGRTLEGRSLRIGLALVLACLATAIVATVAAAVLGGHRSDQGPAAIISIIAFAVVFLLVLSIDAAARNGDLAERRAAQAAHNERYLQLADTTRSVMRHDTAAALLRAFRRAQLDAQNLHVLDELSGPSEGRARIKIVAHNALLTDLQNKCVHGYAPASPTERRPTQVIWLARGAHREWLADRIQLGALFVPHDSALVLCEIVVDLVTGSVKDRILRVPYEKLVSMCLRAECNAEPINPVQTQEERRTRLVLTAADGASVEVPLSFTQITTSDGLTPLDRPEMTPDEQSADRILTWLETKSTKPSHSGEVMELHPAPSYSPPQQLGALPFP
jgi:Tfp pilus assembly protein PilX